MSLLAIWGAKEDQQIIRSEKVNMSSWTPVEDQILKELYGLKTARYIADRLNRTVKGVYGRADYLGLCNNTINRSVWTSPEDDYLKNKYGLKKTKEIATELNRSVAAVHQRASYLKITSPVWRERA